MQMLKRSSLAAVLIFGTCCLGPTAVQAKETKPAQVEMDFVVHDKSSETAVRSDRATASLPRPVYRDHRRARRYSGVQLASRAAASHSRLNWPAGGYISSDFGYRGRHNHQGVDICNPTGTAIRAAQRGIVRHTGWDGAYGLVVDVDHGNGVSTRYAHCSKILVSPGDRVQAGETIARVGSTGRTTAPHVHFEVRVNGSPVDPLPYMASL